MHLRHLIATCKGARTYRDLEADSGGTISHTRWQQLATRDPREFPTPKTIAAIATALGVSQQAVLLATGESLGLHTERRARLIDLLPDAVATLPDQAVTAILAIVTAMLTIHDKVNI